MSLQPGTRIGPYEILRMLGSGGMGTVYLARDLRLERSVALKFLQPGVGSIDSPQGRSRLLREARAASALNHQGICQIYDVGGDDADAWIAMEYIDGTPLDRMIDKGPLAPHKATRIASQLADALAHAHQRGIIHRDLKSSNIVLNADGRPKMLDFGIATRLPESVAHEATRTDSREVLPPFAGSVPYMAPELLQGAAPDERSDLWSLGVVMYEMLTATRPFQGRTLFETSRAILEGAAPPLPSGIPAPLVHIVNRLLSPDPADRYAHASDVAAALDAQTAGDVGERTGPAIQRQQPAIDRPRFSHGRLALMLAGLAIIVAAGLTWTLMRYKPLAIAEQQLASTTEASYRASSYSPDGTTLAFVAPDAKGIQQVWVRNLSSTTPLQITFGDANADRPRWSPGNDQIVYAVAGRGIWSVPPLGGAAKQIIPQGTNPNFSRDGGRLVFEARRSIWTAAVDGSDRRLVEGTPALYYTIPMGPAFSPDGSTIAFFHAEAGPNGDLWTIPATGGVARQLTFDLREGGWPVWTPDGRAIVFSSARAGSRNLWQIRAEGGEPLPLTTGAGSDDQPDISLDGRHLTYTNLRHKWELRVRSLATGNERSLLQRGLQIVFPKFSPDGQRIVFFGRADYAVAIFTIGADGSDLRQLTGGRELNHMPRWSHDGQSIFFYQLKPTVSFRRVAALGGPSADFLPWEWQTATSPSFSPDGRYVAYVRQRPLGAPSSIPEHTIIRDIATGNERVWPEPHLHVGGWSPDSRAVVGFRHDKERSYVVAMCQVAEWQCRDLTSGRAPAWPAGGRIYFMRPPDVNAPQQLWSIAEEGTGERWEMDLGVFPSIDAAFDVSRNGDVVWAPYEAGRHELWTAVIR